MQVFLQVTGRAVSCELASMKCLLQVLAVGALLLVDAATASATDCTCGQLSAEDCLETGDIRSPPAEPLWCERSDDPRCMPASTHGTSVHTLVPVAMSWAHPLRWGAPSTGGVRMEVDAEGEPRAEHSRRVERPPR
jgi:hypothetical protein